MILLPQTDLDPKGPQFLPVALQQRMWASQTGLAVVQRRWMWSETGLAVVQWSETGLAVVQQQWMWSETGLAVVHHQWMWAETVLARSQMDLQSTVQLTVLLPMDVQWTDCRTALWLRLVAPV